MTNGHRRTVRRSLAWSAVVPRHHMTHECIARRFAAESGLGEVTWFNRGTGPAQFHVSGCRQTYEVERAEAGDGTHRFDVRRLALTCPDCGREADRLDEGRCDECREATQAELDRWNARHDRWAAMAESERGDEIRRA